MDLETLYEAVDVVRASGYVKTAREATFLRTYPLMLTTARLRDDSPVDSLLRIATLAYGWMPQALHLDRPHLSRATDAFEAARGEAPAISQKIIEPIAACLGSLVGAAKVLHLANPAVFPLWSPQVERFRLQEPPTAYHMAQPCNYLNFLEEVQILAAHSLFLTFHHDYCTAYQARLQRLGIPAYPLTETRVIESAASELAGS